MKDLPTVKKVITHFHQLPGVGKKTAERYVFFLIHQKNKNNILSLADDLKELVSNIKYCYSCGNLTEHNVCGFCSDFKRDHSKIMVVSDISNLYYFENTKKYNGLYHVLGGLIDFSRFIKPENLNLNSLKNRLSNISEIIIATNSTFEGDITANYVKNFVQQNFNIKITRLAFGIPIGVDFNYIDSKTLSKAIEDRHNFEGEKN